MKNKVIRKLFLLCCICCVLDSCAQIPGNNQNRESLKADTTKKPLGSMIEYLPTIENAHPNAKKLMKEEFFWSPIEETAPFGNDDGADTYPGFAKWRQSNKSTNPINYLKYQIDYWGYPTFNVYETNYDKLKSFVEQSDLGITYLTGIDAAIISIAFGQLYLEGTIDHDFRELSRIAIKRQLIPELLNRWGENYKPVREQQLLKMLEVLNQVN